MSVAKVSAKGWIVIPSDLRKKYGLTPGTRVSIVDYGGALTIVPVPSNPIAAAYGMFADMGAGSWTQELVEERRREREKEERRLGE